MIFLALDPGRILGVASCKQYDQGVYLLHFGYTVYSLPYNDLFDYNDKDLTLIIEQPFSCLSIKTYGVLMRYIGNMEQFYRERFNVVEVVYFTPKAWRKVLVGHYGCTLDWPKVKSKIGKQYAQSFCLGLTGVETDSNAADAFSLLHAYCVTRGLNVNYNYFVYKGKFA